MNKTLSIFLSSSLAFSAFMLVGCNTEEVVNDIADIINDGNIDDDSSGSENENPSLQPTLNEGDASFLLTDTSNNREKNLAVTVQQVTLEQSDNDTSVILSETEQTLFLNQANQLNSLIISSEDLPFGSYDEVVFQISALQELNEDGSIDLEVPQENISLALNTPIVIDEESPALTSIEADLYDSILAALNSDTPSEIDPIPSQTYENPLVALNASIEDIIEDTNTLQVCTLTTTGDTVEIDTSECYELLFSLNTQVLNSQLEPITASDLEIGDSVSVIGQKTNNDSDQLASLQALVVQQDVKTFSVQGHIASIEELGTDGENTINVRMSIDLLCPNWDFDDEGFFQEKPLPDSLKTETEDSTFIVDASHTAFIFDEEGNPCSLECLVEGQGVDIFGANADDIKPDLLAEDSNTLDDSLSTDMLSVVIQLKPYEPSEDDGNDGDNDNNNEDPTKPLSLTGFLDIDNVDFDNNQFILSVDDNEQCVNFSDNTEFYTVLDEEKTSIPSSEIISGFTEVAGVLNEECIDAEFVIIEVENNDDGNDDNNGDNNGGDGNLDGHCDGDSLRPYSNRFTLIISHSEQCIEFNNETLFSNNIGENLKLKGDQSPLRDGPVSVLTEGTTADGCKIATEIIVKF